MQTGERLCLFDGSGEEADARICAIEKDHVVARITALHRIDRESPLAITLAVSISRGERMDLTVQKATELGAARIWPFISERTGVRLKEERLAKKQAHWQRIAISACEQSGRNLIPSIDAVCSYHDLLRKADNAQLDAAFVLHPNAGQSALPAALRSVLMLAGPEGGFTEDEVGVARDAGFVPLQLGPRVLRTETAPLAAIAVAQARWGDFYTAA